MRRVIKGRQLSLAAATPKSAFERSLGNSSDFQMTTLSNGLRVASERVPSQVSTIGVWLNSGSRYETAEENGVAHYLEHLFFKGTSTRSKAQFEQLVEDRGIHLNAYTTREHIGYFSQMTKDNQEEGLSLIADILQNATLTDAAVDAERDIIIREMKEVEGMHEEVVLDYLHHAGFRNCSLGRTILGPAENIRSFTSDHLKNYMKKHYTTDRMVIVGAGDIDHNQLVKWTEKLFNSIPQSTDTSVAIPEPVNFVGSDYRHRIDDMERAVVGYAFPVPGTSDPKFWSMQVAQHMLGSWDKSVSQYGQHSMSALTRSLVKGDSCEKFFSFNHLYQDVGLLGVYAEGTAYQLHMMMFKIASEMTRLCHDVDKNQFEVAKRNAITAAFAPMTSSVNVCHSLVTSIDIV